MTRGNKKLRALDHYLGRAVIFLLRFFPRRKKTLPTSIRSIAFLKLAGIGDLVLLTPMIEAMKRAYPEATITLICAQENAPLASLIPSLERTLILPIQNLPKTLRLLRQHSYDLFIDAGQWSRFEALLSFCSKSGYTIGFKTPHQHRHALYNRKVPHLRSVHESENFRALINPYVSDVSETPSFSFDPKKRLVDEPYLVFHTRASGIHHQLKEWPQTSWVKLALNLEKMGHALVLTGSRGDLESCQSLGDLMKKSGFTGKIYHLCGKMAFTDLPSLLAQARCVVSVNTGIMHLAAAVGATLISLNGPASIERWGPKGPNTHSLAPEGGSYGYLHLGFEYPRKGACCMDQITPESVTQAVLKVLND